MPLNGWHFGERLIHQKHNFHKDPYINTLVSHINGDLDPDHALFHSTRLPFMPVTTLDNEGRPWGSILASENGLPGPHFIKNSRYTTLAIRTKVWEGEPFLENAKLYRNAGEEEQEREERMLIAGIGLEFPTRRRNKLAGWVSKLEKKDNDIFELELTVNQSLGNCPKYITTRHFVPFLDTKPQIKHQNLHLPSEDRLPEEVITFIHDSDTVFLGTTYAAPAEDAKQYPSHVGMNQRGGRKGFIRVSSSDGKTVVLPDYSGNRFLTSLGNIESTHLASLTFISFLTGSILYLTGEAQNHIGSDAKRIMPFHTGSLTTIRTTGYTFVLDALPIRLDPLNERENPSPYSPPVSYLAEEAEFKGSTKLFGSDTEPTTALLSRIQLHTSPSSSSSSSSSTGLASFTFEPSHPISVSPTQALILDFSSLLGKREYQHMANHNPKSVNDDRIRTWTVSNSSEWTASVMSPPPTTTSGGSPSPSFTLTMREQPQGLVTGALFSIARRLAEARPELLGDTRVLDIRVGIVGVSGGFGVPKLKGQLVDADVVPSGVEKIKTKKFLWIAGGIGVTPFLSMLRAPFMQMDGSSTEEQEQEQEWEWDVHLILSTRTPEILIPLIRSAYEDGQASPSSSTSTSTSTSTTEDSQSLQASKARPGITRVKGIKLRLDVYSSGTSSTQPQPQSQPQSQSQSLPEVGNEGVEGGIKIYIHTGRVPSNLFSSPHHGSISSNLEGLPSLAEEWVERDVYLCGPKAFEDSIVKDLVAAGVGLEGVKRETFAY